MTMSTQARRNRLVLVAVGVGIVAALLVLARGALFPFILTGILAYILYPIVSAVESRMPGRRRWPDISRIVAIWLIFLLSLAVIAGIAAVAVPPTLSQAADFVDEVPDYYGRAPRGDRGLERRVYGAGPRRRQAADRGVRREQRLDPDYRRRAPWCCARLARSPTSSRR